MWDIPLFVLSSYYSTNRIDWMLKLPEGEAFLNPYLVAPITL